LLRRRRLLLLLLLLLALDKLLWWLPRLKGTLCALPGGVRFPSQRSPGLRCCGGRLRPMDWPRPCGMV
jgi:hypothetical protein